MKQSLYKYLYFQVIVAIIIGILLGHFQPTLGSSMKPLGDGFIKLIKMIIAPIIFCTVVIGIASMGDVKKVGRVGGKAVLYFEVVSTVALTIGLIIMNFFRPGSNMNVDVSSLDPASVANYTKAASSNHGFADFLLNILPSTVVDAFAKGDILQVLFFSVLFGFALSALGPQGKKLLTIIEDISQVFFKIINIIMRFAPLGAFGAMAFTIGNYGLKSLGPLAELMGTFYLTCLLFIFVVLGAISKYIGFNILDFITYIKDELLIVLGTSSSESVLPRIMHKLEDLGCSKSVVGLVIPTGYSFNLDGTSIYLTMAALFVAQATNTDLTLLQQLTILAVLMLTSKGASGVTGSGFVTLAATLSVVPTIPVAGLALILGIDRFMSEARALTNLIGNGVATLAISKWENELNYDKLNAELNADEEDLATEKCDNN